MKSRPIARRGGSPSGAADRVRDPGGGEWPPGQSEAAVEANGGGVPAVDHQGRHAVVGDETVQDEAAHGRSGAASARPLGGGDPGEESDAGRAPGVSGARRQRPGGVARPGPAAHAGAAGPGMGVRERLVQQPGDVRMIRRGQPRGPAPVAGGGLRLHPAEGVDELQARKPGHEVADEVLVAEGPEGGTEPGQERAEQGRGGVGGSGDGQPVTTGQGGGRHRRGVTEEEGPRAAEQVPCRPQQQRIAVRRGPDVVGGTQLTRIGHGHRVVGAGGRAPWPGRRAGEHLRLLAAADLPAASFGDSAGGGRGHPRSAAGRGRDPARPVGRSVRRHLQPVPTGPARDAVRVLASVAEFLLPGRVGLAVGFGPLGVRALLVAAAALGNQAAAHRGDQGGLPPDMEEPGPREGRVLGLGAGLGIARPPAGLVREPVGDARPQAVHGEAPRVLLAGLPLLVADDRALRPPVVPADRGGHLLDGLLLRLGPRVLAVAEVDALEAVEVPVAVDVGLVVPRQLRLVDDRPQHVAVTEPGVVGAAVADEVDVTVLVDHAVAERPRQTGVAVVADVHGVLGARGDGVVDHDAVHRAPGPLGVAVVVAPVAHLVDRQALRAQDLQQLGRAHRLRHRSSPSAAVSAAAVAGRPGRATLVTPDARRRTNLAPCGVGATSFVQATPMKGFVKANTWHSRIPNACHRRQGSKDLHGQYRGTITVRFRCIFDRVRARGIRPRAHSVVTDSGVHRPLAGRGGATAGGRAPVRARRPLNTAWPPKAWARVPRPAAPHHLQACRPHRRQGRPGVDVPVRLGATGLVTENSTARDPATRTSDGTPVPFGPPTRLRTAEPPCPSGRPPRSARGPCAPR
ncbi:hypothetical protein SGPA1_21636 [Streptomyces misionensis JCM 4497]